MAIGDEVNKLKKEFSGINDEANEFQAALGDIASAMGKAAKESEDLNQIFKQGQSSVKGIANLTKELGKASKDSLGNQTEINSLNKVRNKLLGEERRVQSQLRILEIRRQQASGETLRSIEKQMERLSDSLGYSGDIANNYDKILKTNKELEKSNPFKGAADFVKDIPVINKLLGNMVQASEKYNAEMKESGDRTKALAKGVGEYLQILGKAAFAFVIKEAISAINYIDTASVSLANNLGISKNEAIGLTQEFANQSKELRDMGMSYKDIMEANIQLTSLQGTSALYTKESALGFKVMTKNLGLSAEQASKMEQFARATGTNAKDQTAFTMGITTMENKRYGVAVSQREIAQETATISSNIALSTKAQGNNLESAVHAAKRLGLSMAQVESIAGGLLDFETSIAAEMEAELLIGKDLNLERARLAALNNDMKTVAKEVTKQGITQASFAGMNAIQQSSVAKSLGMTAKDMGDMLIRQTALKKLGPDIKNEGDVAKLIQEMKAAGKTDEEITTKIGNKQLQDAAQNLTMKEQMRKLIDDLASNVMPVLVRVFQALNKLLNFLSNSPTGTKIAGAGVVGAMGLGLGAKMMGGVGMRGMVKRFMPGKGSAGSGGKMFNPLTMTRDKAGRAQYNKIGRGMGKTPGFVPGVKSAGTFGKRLLKGARGGVGGLLGGMALDYGADMAKEAGHETLGKSLSIGSSALSGAGMGAMIGSIIPGIGTAIGGAVGGIVGGIYGTYQEFVAKGDEQLEEQKKTNELLTKQTEQLDNQNKELYDAISAARNIELNGVNLANEGISTSKESFRIQ